MSSRVSRLIGETYVGFHIGIVFAVFDVFEGFEEDFSDVVEFSVGGDEVEEVGGEFCVCGYFVKDQDSDSGVI